MVDLLKRQIHDVSVTPDGDLGLLAEFWAYQPLDKYVNEEQPGDKAWLGGELKAIKADKSIPFVDLPQILQDLVKNCWERKEISISKRAGNFMGSHRPNPSPVEAAKAQYVPMVSPTEPAKNTFAYLKGVANDWKVHEEMKRINAYTFRGDFRTPAMIKQEGGFGTSSTRTDDGFVMGAMFNQFKGYMKRRFNKDLGFDGNTFLQIYKQTLRTNEAKQVMINFSLWRALADSESMHLSRMAANEVLKGYISTSRATTIAKGYAKPNGWVYLTLVNGGFVLPSKTDPLWTSIFGEQEIAYPGALPWANIFGFRKVSADAKPKFTGPIFLRKGFESNEVFETCFKLLSGKKQG